MQAHGAQAWSAVNDEPLGRAPPDLGRSATVLVADHRAVLRFLFASAVVKIAELRSKFGSLLT